MQEDFHYYATYCAAYLAGYNHAESLDIAYSAQFVDLCTRTLLAKLKAPTNAATTQLQMELMDAATDPLGLQDITRIWASFHFLPGDLTANPGRFCSKIYRSKYRLICRPNSDLMVATVRRAKNTSLQAVGLAMHVLADTWAHSYFAGTPSLVINNTNSYFYEILPEGMSVPAGNASGNESKTSKGLADASSTGALAHERKISFRHSPTKPDDLEKGLYTGSLYQSEEHSIMNLGHGRAGHLPDYSFMRYRYLPAWGNYEEIVKDNPSDYMHAFRQMVQAMKYLRGDVADFGKEQYDAASVDPYADEIREILEKRQLLSCADWKAFGEKLSKEEIDDFDLNRYQEEYQQAPKDHKDETFLGKFFLAALSQKSMVTHAIFQSGNLLAGVSIEYNGRSIKGIQDYARLVRCTMQDEATSFANAFGSSNEEVHHE